MKKRNWIAAAFASAVLLVGCGSDSKPDGSDLPVGTSTGISVEYVGSNYQPEKGFINTYKVHIADKNGNPISAPVKISVINGFGKVANENGMIHATRPITFDDPTVSFGATGVSPNDKLIVLPTQYRSDPSYLGDWTIQSVGNALTLKEGAYYLTEADNLRYVIGNERRVLGNRIGVVHIETDANATSNEAGYIYFDVVADTILAAHPIVIGVHTEGNRLGAALLDSVRVRRTQIIADSVTIAADGESHNIYLRFLIDANEDGVGTEPLIDVSIYASTVVSSDPVACSIDYNYNTVNGYYATDEYGLIKVKVDTVKPADENITTECTISWEGF